MSVYVRSCPTGKKFNTGGSYCPIDPTKVKAVFFSMKDIAIENEIIGIDLTAMCHADRPERIYPIKNIVEYAPSGGEAQVETVGYGAPKVVGYSSRDDVFTLGVYDIELVKNIAKMKSQKVYVFYVDSDNQIHGRTKEDDNSHFYGIPAMIYLADQPFDTSSTNANTQIHIALSDTEQFLQNRVVIKKDYDVVDALIGLMSVKFVKPQSNSQFYYLVDSSNTNISSAYKDITADCFVEAESVSYNASDDSFTISGNTELKSPRELAEKNIYGIEYAG